MKLTDLIAAGRLPVGTEVYHQARRHADRSVVGRVQPGGIELNGTVYASPSGAARAVSGTSAENGWTWWRVRSTGKTLADLRPTE